MERFIAVLSGDSMWPTYHDGDRLICSASDTIDVGSVVVFKHPLRANLNAVKRVSKIEGDWMFVEGDNPDPTSSNDSHNFGRIARSSILGVVVDKEVWGCLVAGLTGFEPATDGLRVHRST